MLAAILPWLWDNIAWWEIIFFILVVGASGYIFIISCDIITDNRRQDVGRLHKIERKVRRLEVERLDKIERKVRRLEKEEELKRLE